MMTVDDAIFCEAMPCNPIPFARGLAALVSEKGTDAIKSDAAKRILWVLMAQAYGQMAKIDLSDEWSRLANTDGFEHGERQCPAQATCFGSNTPEN